MLLTLEKWLRWATGGLAALALFAIMWLTLVDVLGRKFLSHSVPGGLEMTEILMVMVIFGALPMVSWRGEHVVFDTFDPYIPAAVKRWQQRGVHGLCAVVFAGLAWLLTQRAARMAEYDDVTQHWQWPVAPVAWVMAALLLLTALVHLLFVFFPTAEGSGPERPSAEATATPAASPASAEGSR